MVVYWYAGHLMEKIESENLLHRAFSVFLFNSKYELLLQVCIASDIWSKSPWDLFPLSVFKASLVFKEKHHFPSPAKQKEKVADKKLLLFRWAKIMKNNLLLFINDFCLKKPYLIGYKSYFTSICLRNLANDSSINSNCTHSNYFTLNFWLIPDNLLFPS